MAVFRECKRILRDDGTLWVNIGDSYASMKSRYNQKGQSLNGGKPQDNEFQGNKTDLYHHPELGLKDKDLIGIPWMLAFALRADGWYLRSDIIWAKPNPMPESVKDRCTKSHEYIFLLSKSKKYYYDNEAVKEETITSQDDKSHHRFGAPNGKVENTPGKTRIESGEKWNNKGVRNKRDVWTVTTKPYKGAHYATFNPELIKPCILAGAPETVCDKCGAPYARVTEQRDADVQKPRAFAKKGNADRNDTGEIYKEMVTITTGFQPTCSCNAGTSSGIVFDPFVGSGTTVATAIKLGRKGIGIDLNIKYLTENARQRIADAQKQPRLI